eukprot:4115963-Karenia_brevis.AAC.1
MQWWWENDIGAIQNSRIQCWVCGTSRHMGRNCFSKGDGKGGAKGKGADAPTYQVVPGKGAGGGFKGGVPRFKGKGAGGGFKGGVPGFKGKGAG